MELISMGQKAVKAKYELQKLTAEVKNRALLTCADALIKKSDLILSANKLDVEHGIANGMHPGLVDRLTLTVKRLDDMAIGPRQISDLEDPIGEILERN